MRPIIVGHRGVSGHYPENTKVSIEAAISMGLEWIEVDVQPTKDRQLVICHDHTVDRCSNGEGRVDQHTLEALKTLDFGSWFSSDFAREEILTLGELFAIVKASNIKLNLEIKLDTDCAQEVVTSVAQLLNEYQIDDESIILSSFNPHVMKALGEQCREYKLGVICDKLSSDVLALLKTINAYSCHLNYKHINAADLKKLAEIGCAAWCFTVNDPASFPLLDKVDAIFSDYPERFAQG
ncbi:glycerophosphodiester phosphodiesterase family protein [Vibrio sp. M260118]|uniref:glycerophosphodiester phosphodiesterase family protein n=1 Tax=Vibrio sp. M260118 TaxID=3020896 RepID=UPI002F3E4896